MDLKNNFLKKTGFNWGLPLVIFLLIAFLPLYGSSYNVTLFIYFLLYMTLAVAWTIFSGATGYISLATAAFYGLGIYAAALFGESMPFIFVIFIGGAASFVLAFLVGALTLRLKGIFFAMFTFGLVLLMKEVLYWWELTIESVRGYFVVSYSNNAIFYYLLGLLLVTIIVAYAMSKSKYGLALKSIGENEEAADHIGVNVTLVKITTFAISATFMGAAGVIMASKLTYIDPVIAFNPMMSFSPALMATFGGMGNLYGPVIGAVIFTYLQEILTTGTLKSYYMLIFGSILVVTIMYLPRGILGLFQQLWNRFRRVKSAPTSRG